MLLGSGKGRKGEDVFMSSQKRRGFLFLAGCLLWVWAVPVMSAEFPSKPVTYIVPWTAGNTDSCARVLANVTGKYLGQPVIVENKPGADGTLGPSTMAATAKPDGYTVSQMPLTLYRYPQLMKTTYNPLTDFSYIIHLDRQLFGAVVRADSPFKTFPEVVAYAKANPGKLTYGTTGGISIAYTTMEMVARKNGVKWVNVPQKGSGELCSAVLGGHVMLGMTTSGWAPLVASGDLRLLATFGNERIKKYANVPTAKELGYGVVTRSTYGLAGPKGMDPKIVRILHDAFKKGMESPEYQKILDQYDMTSEYMNSADYEKYARELWEEEKMIVQQLDLKMK
jgi:tripartite-type tricarboxylate transporter receptor subunit TctC